MTTKEFEDIEPLRKQLGSDLLDLINKFEERTGWKVGRSERDYAAGHYGDPQYQVAYVRVYKDYSGWYGHTDGKHIEIHAAVAA